MKYTGPQTDFQTHMEIDKKADGQTGRQADSRGN